MEYKQTGTECRKHRFQLVTHAVPRIKLNIRIINLPSFSNTFIFYFKTIYQNGGDVQSIRGSAEELHLYHVHH